MKLVGLVGSNAEHSYNRLLLKEIGARFSHLFSLELLEISEVPLFNPSAENSDNEEIEYFNQKILDADGVIIATPEHNHTIPPALKSVLEWLSYKVHPFEEKPVMVVGASYDVLGTSRSQLHLRQILEAPGLRAHVFPGNEFLLGRAKEAFDEQGTLTDPKTIQYLSECIEKFARFVHVLKQVEQPRYRKQGIIHQSYQLGDFSKGMDNSEVAEIIKQLKMGEKSVVHYHVPTGNEAQYIVHTFQTVTDEEGSIVSIEEFIMDYVPIIEQYLKHTGQRLTKDEGLTVEKETEHKGLEISEVDVLSSASQHLKSNNLPLQTNADSNKINVDTTSSPTQLSEDSEEGQSEKTKAKFIYANHSKAASSNTETHQPHIIKVVDVTFGASKKQSTVLDTITTTIVKHLDNEVTNASLDQPRKIEQTEPNKQDTKPITKSEHHPTIIDATSGASDKY